MPIPPQCFPCSLAAAGGKTIREHDGVSRASTRSGDTLEMDGFFFEQAVEHTPGESAVAAAALEREIDCAFTRAFVKTFVFMNSPCRKTRRTEVHLDQPTSS